MWGNIPFEASAAEEVRFVQISLLEPPQKGEKEMKWICRRCGHEMYSVVAPDGARATCSSCSQYVDCAQCSNKECGDTKCLKCYNKAVTGVKRPSGEPLVPQDEEIS